MEGLLTLQAGSLTVALAPSVGGSIARFTIADGRRSLDVMRPASEAALAAREPLGMASFPMIPFCGRIAQARFSFGGDSYQLARNFGESPHAIHGNAWQRTWRIVSQAGDKTELELTHDSRDRGAEWPFRYVARQTFALAPDALSLALEVTNTDTRPMPLSFGHHPYFPISPEARIATRVTSLWENDATMLPSRRVTVPAALDFSEGLTLADLTLDTCFAGWVGATDLDWPDLGLALRIEADPIFGHFVVYTPPERTYFCAEPQSAAPDAVGLAGRGVQDSGLLMLAPGETASGGMRFAPRLTGARP
jgi:aldose 1-epimerase